MVKSIEITKTSIKDRLIIDSEGWMEHPDDHDFQPRAKIEGKKLMIHNAGTPIKPADVDLNEEEFHVAERDRLFELRVKFGVTGMHGVLTNRNPNPRMGPNAKKLAESRWKTLLPIDF